MKLDAKDLAKIALMTATIIVLGFVPPIPLGFIPVPIILQNMGIMIAGALLGEKKGTLSVVIFLLIGIVVPVLSGRTVLAVLGGPTAGYIISWIFAPALIAYGIKAFPKGFVWELVSIWLFGVLFVDVIGALWLAEYTKMGVLKALVSNLVFIPGDTVKTAVAAIIANRLRNRI